MRESFFELVRQDAQEAAEQLGPLDVGVVEVARAIEANFRTRAEVARRLDSAVEGETMGFLGRREGI